MRRTDYAYRIGGDEFALILVPAANDDARVVIDRIRASADADEPVSASFGVAVYGEQGGADDLFRRADEAMYEAKRSGGSAAVAA